MPRWAKTHRLQPTYCHSAIASPAIPDSIVIPLTACKVGFSVTSQPCRASYRTPFSGNFASTHVKACWRRLKIASWICAIRVRKTVLRGRF